MVISDYTYEQGKIIAANIMRDVDKWDEALQRFPRGEMGLIPDEIKNSDEYRTAKAQYDYYFSKLRIFNAGFTKRYKREMMAERKGKRANP